MNKWNKKPNENDQEQDEWVVTQKMVAQFLKEWDELGNPCAIMEKYGAVRCESRKIPDELLPDTAWAGKKTDRVMKRAISAYRYEYEDKNNYYNKFIRNSVYGENEANIFQDWELPIIFFKKLEERANEKRIKQSIAEKLERIRLQKLSEQFA